jgi:SAM-dependent methyltransferase
LIRILFNLSTTYFRLYEALRVAILFYPKALKFLTIDLHLAFLYLFKNPHRISKSFLSQRGEPNVYQYGETPLTTLNHIACHCRILSHDVLYELGCGSGRTCFWLRTFVKCKVVGIDFLPEFIQKANAIKKKQHLNHIDFLNADMLSVDFSEATVIYLYGTCLPDHLIEQLLASFATLKPLTKVITVSYPLTDYCQGKLFKTIKSFPARFPWGSTIVYLSQKI